MPNYRYRARDQQGKIVKGTLHAVSESRVTSLLQSNGLTPVFIQAVEKLPFWQRDLFGSSVKRPDLVLFFRQTASMVRAGVPILEALEAIAKQVSKESFRTMILEVAHDIEAGESLSNAMVKHYNVFNPFIIGVIRTGEASGRLSDSMDSLAEYIEKDYIFFRKVRAAFIYPSFVLGIVLLLTIIMFTFVLPQLVGLFDEAGVELPLPTRILIAVSLFMQKYWILLALLAVLLGGLGRSYAKTPEGSYVISTYLLRLPLLRTLFQKLYLARLTSLLHTLFTSDVPALESLKLAKEAVGNRVYQRILDDTVKAVQDGASISSVWARHYFIPPLLTSIVAVGERSGTLGKSFSEASLYFKRDVEAMLESITTLLEPILIVILGIGVGIVVASVLLPIYDLVLVL